jgi:two-component system, LuxR family, sensor kinase FixL
VGAWYNESKFERCADQIAMSDDNFAHRYRTMQRYLGWNEDDARQVAALGPLVAPHADSLISDFYAEIRRHPEAMQVITGGSEQMARLSRSLHAWLAELLAGPHDEAYMARRWKVGHRHVEIGLAQRYASLALARLRAGIVQSVEREWQGDVPTLGAAIRSLHKLLDLEHALIQDAYEFEYVRRERQLERERSERKFRHLVESASCLIVILNPEQGVVYFNPCAERTTGYRADELRRHAGRVLSLLGREAQQMAERVRAVLAGGGVTAHEEQIQGRTGPPRWITWTLSRIDDFDEGPAVLAVGHDVTEAKLAAEQLLQASRLATIGEMYAGLAHESRNALQRLRVCTDMLTDQVSDRPTAIGLLERAQRAQEDLQQLLDEVRNFASPIVLDRTECRLAALWREGWSLLQLQRRTRRAELVDDSCDASLTIRADRFRMVQAFRNVLENALAACEDPVVIRICCRATEIEGQAGIEISVDDNGPGFADATVHRAFEPFFTTKPTGTGLGLAIVRRIIEAHGGQASASRAGSGGARICLTLPFRDDD